MKNLNKIGIIFFIFLMIANGYEKNKEFLPAGLTEEEKSRLHEIGKNKTITPAPEGNFRSLAEYEKTDGVIFSWDSGFSTLLINLITAVTQEDTAYIVVSSASEQSSVETQLNNSGVDLSKVQFYLEYLNSIWMRDYGPWWILNETGTPEILDFIYNRPRPDDDEFPEWLANNLNIPYYCPNLVHPGGNFIIDGHGMGFMTSLIEEENSQYSTNEIRQIFKDYANLDSIIIITPMQYDGTGHIDMFCKLLNDTTLIIGEYENPGDGAGQNYNILNQNAAALSNLTNLEGKPINIERIIMPPYSGGVSYTYTNSLIVNNLVLVPVYGFDTDSEALELYQDLMPDHNIIGVNCLDIIPSNGAIHCITKLKMAGKPVEQIIPGDINRDYAVNILDVVVMINIILGDTETTDWHILTGDLDDNNSIDVTDIVLLIHLLLYP